MKTEMGMASEIDDLFCELCGSESLEHLFNTHDMRYDHDEPFAVLRCQHCGLAFTRPKIHPQEFQEYYRDGFHYSPEEVDEVGLWGRIFHAIGRLVNPDLSMVLPAGPILDVGCGNGLPSQRFVERGHSVVGVEIDPEAAESARARGLDVKIGDFLAMSLEPGSFQSVLMRHSLEHFVDFRAALGKANSLLKPGGVLYVCLPNLDSFPAKVFGRYWFPLEVPRHINHFNLRTLEKALNLTGFHIDRVVFDYSFEPFTLLKSLEYLTRGHTSGFLDRGFRALHTLLYPLGLLLAATSMASSMNIYALKDEAIGP